jgi:hypothetical protein
MLRAVEHSGRRHYLDASVQVAALLSVVLSGGAFLWWGDVGLDLADEGFLWYGVQRTVAGEMPVRDFQSYAPARYYWCAAWAPLVGSGILGVRAALAAFQALGLFFGLLVARRVVPSVVWLVPTALVLFLWMAPRHKLFEPAIAMMVVYAAVRLLERRDSLGPFLVGFACGLFGVFGRNHLLYVGVGMCLVLAVLAWKEEGFGRAIKLRFLTWLGGCVAGYAPMLVFLAGVPEFRERWFGAILSDLRDGPNRPLPWPWPWRVELGGLEGLELLIGLGTAVAFVFPVLVVVLGLLRTAQLRRGELSREAVTVAATLVGVVYLHHVSVRSAPNHLTQCIQPLLIAAIALPGALSARREHGVRAGVLALLGIVGFLTTAPANPLLRERGIGVIGAADAPAQLVEHEVAGETLQLSVQARDYLANVERMSALRVGPDADLLITPQFPTLYAVLGRTAPVWQLFLSRPATEETEREMISRLELARTEWALVIDHPIDGREEFLLRNTHPLLWRHLHDAFEEVETPAFTPDHHLFRLRRGRRGDR